MRNCIELQTHTHLLTSICNGLEQYVPKQSCPYVFPMLKLIYILLFKTFRGEGEIPLYKQKVLHKYHGFVRYNFLLCPFKLLY